MSDIYRCIACGRVISPEDMTYRYPPDFPGLADMVYENYGKLRGIKNLNIILPGFCTPSSPEIVKTVENDGRTQLISNTGRIIEKKICPACHNQIYRGTQAEKVNSVLFFGMPNSGRTSLIMALVEETVGLGYDIANDSFVCLLNDQLSSPEQFKGVAENIKSNKKPDDIRHPVLVYRVPSAVSGLPEQCDVYYDIAYDDVKSEATADMLVPFGHDAQTFVYTIPVSELVFPDNHQRDLNDMDIRQNLYMLMLISQYSSFKPNLVITITKVDELFEGKISGNGTGFLTENIMDEAAVERFFRANFQQSSLLLEDFASTKFCVVSAAKPHFEDGTNCLVNLFNKLI